MTNESEPDKVVVSKARISFSKINGIPLRESRISFSDISTGADSRISYTKISSKSQAQTKNTNGK